MTPITIIVSLFFSIIALNTKRGTALGILVLSVLLWPEYLRFSVFGIQMSADRFVALCLLIKSFVRPEYRLGKLNSLDKIIILSFLWDIFANLMGGADFAHVKWVIGRGLDTTLMYFVARYMIRSKGDLRDFIWPLLICGIVLGVLAGYESITFYSPYQYLFKFHTWVWIDRQAELRYGFLRAYGSSSHPIYFGISMFFLAAFLTSLRGIALNSRFKNKKILWTVGGVGAVLASFSSMSSGPIITMATFLVFSALFYKRSLITPLKYLTVFMMVFVEIFSNRHFYNMVDYIALNSATAWYRTKLLEVAISQLHEYWLFGFKGRAPHHWGALIDGRLIVDVVNNYIYSAVVSGLLGAIFLLVIQLKVIKNALLLWGNGDEDLRKFAFGMCCLIISYFIGSMSVSVFGSGLVLSYIAYGLISDTLIYTKIK